MAETKKSTEKKTTTKKTTSPKSSTSKTSKSTAAKKTTTKSSTAKKTTTKTAKNPEPVVKPIEVPEPEVKKESVEMYTAGDKYCYVYFDVKTTKECDPTADIIAMALIDADGRSFYAEFTDYNANSMDSTGQEVVKTLHLQETEIKDTMKIKGDRNTVKENLNKWFNAHIQSKRHIQLVGDNASFAFVVFSRFLGGDFGLPYYFSKALVDINHDIANSFTRLKNDPSVSDIDFNFDFIPAKVAYDIPRIGLFKELEKDLPDEYKKYIEENTYNPLTCALFTKTIHQHFWGIN